MSLFANNGSGSSIFHSPSTTGGGGGGTSDLAVTGADGDIQIKDGDSLSNVDGYSITNEDGLVADTLTVSNGSTLNGPVTMDSSLMVNNGTTTLSDLTVSDLTVSGIADLDKVKIGYTIDTRDAVSNTHLYNLDCQNQSYKVFQINTYDGNSHNFDIKNVLLANPVIGGQYVVILKNEVHDIWIESIGTTVFSNLLGIYTNMTLKLDLPAGALGVVTYFCLDNFVMKVIASASIYNNA